MQITRNHVSCRPGPFRMAQPKCLCTDTHSSLPYVRRIRVSKRLILATLRYFELYSEAKFESHEKNCDPVGEERFLPFLGLTREETLEI